MGAGGGGGSLNVYYTLHVFVKVVPNHKIREHVICESHQTYMVHNQTPPCCHGGA